MDYNYLVPANSKKQGLWLGFLKPIDAAILGVGLSVSFVLFLIIRAANLLEGIIAVAPALIAAFLVFPIGNYHNTRIFIREMYRFYFVHRRKYIWRGWCYKYEQSDDK